MNYSKKLNPICKDKFRKIILKKLNGKPITIYPKRFRVKWDKVVGSKFQFEVKQFFREFWEKDSVFEEFVIQDRLRFDLVNLDKKIVVEAHGDQHISFNNHFYKNEKKWKEALFRDVKKEAWVSLNGFKLVEIYPKNLPLDEFWIEDMFGLEVLY